MDQTSIKPTTFTTSRSLDFCTEVELTRQLGHNKEEWPLVTLKELVDNALDACEEAKVAPEITVTIDADGITVADNGPGIPPETVNRAVDFDVRVSSREAYVGPTRGAQGLGLKDVIAMSNILKEGCGRVDVTAGGQRHEIELTTDRIKQEPVPTVTLHAIRNPASGTAVKVWLPDLACSQLENEFDHFLQFAESFTVLNPHLSLKINIFGRQSCIQATNPDWKKYRPSEPSSPYWYGLASFERLIGAFINHDRRQDTDRSVRQFVSGFRGLTGTGKQSAVLADTGLARTNLSVLANGQDFDHVLTEKLLEAMKAHSKPVKPAALGVIGKDHIRARFEPYCQMGSFRYGKQLPLSEGGIPEVWETAFACLDEGDKTSCRNNSRRKKSSRMQTEFRRRFIAGINWSPGIGNPFSKLAGNHGASLDSILEQIRVGQDQPVMLMVHFASPVVQYLDRGKTSVAIA